MGLAGPASRPASYPSRWEADVVLTDGGTVHVRPITPGDASAILALHGRLSTESIYLRFFTPLPTLSPPMLERFVDVDYVDRMALVAELADELVGVARYDRLPGSGGASGAEAEVAFTVDDAQQGRGIGTVLLEHLAAAAKQAGISRFVADVLPHNERMLRVFHDAGFGERRTFSDGVIQVAFSIEPTDASVEAMHQRERQAAARSVQRLLAPGSVAVIGASRRPGSIGQQVVRNLLEGQFAGPVYPVHPTAHHVASVRAYPSVEEIPDEVDLAVIVVPAQAVPEVVDQCARKRVGGLVIISAGFAERGEEGGRVERQLVLTARRNGMRLIGPNCMGVVNTDPAVSLNATFSPVKPTEGRIGFISQSGGLGVVILDQMARRGLGLSTFVSAGNKADVSSNDLLQYWDGDDRTDVVLLYLESFGNPRTFARVARRLSRRKPIVAVKGGRSVAGLRAAAQHTAALAATDTAVDALFLQSGVIRVDTLEELFDVAQVLATQPLPRGRRVGIVGNAGGPGVLAADACEAIGLSVPELSAGSQKALRTALGDTAVVRNPVDLAPTAGPSDFDRTVKLVLADEAIDAVLVIFSAPLSPHLEGIVGAILGAAAASTGKPLLASVLGRQVVMGGSEGRVPSFAFPESAVRALGRVGLYAEWRRRPAGQVIQFGDVDREAARRLVDRWLRDTAEPVWLDPTSAGQLLGAYGISAGSSGPPAGVATVVEVIEDRLFGPLIAFGAGGLAAELPGDRAFRSLPLTDLDAADLVRTGPVARLLAGVAGAPPANLPALEELLLRMAQLADAVPEIVELVLDPVVAGPETATAGSARVRLAPRPPRPEQGLRRLR